MIFPLYHATITGEDLEDPARKERLWQKRRDVLDAYRARDEAVAAGASPALGPGADHPAVADFYRGRHVLVTGGTGFVGKVLIEKLLRVCPDIGAIFVLVRPRKGLGARERLEAMLALPCFDRLREDSPAVLAKLVAVPGDCEEEGLGLDAEDRRVLVDRVSVLFHSAASVRFTDPIKKAVQQNLRPARDVVQLAREMPQLKALVHVSTAYCFTDHNPIQECVYATQHDWRDVIKYASLPDARALDTLGPKFLGFQPNPYVFTKALAERVMEEAAADLPVIILRPSIITCSAEEPMPGWMDNMYGFAGFWAAVIKGVWRVSYTRRQDVKFDLVPVDFVSQLCILASWAKGTGLPLPRCSGDAEVINVTISDVKPGTLDLMQNTMTQVMWEGKTACPGAVRYPHFRVVENKILGMVLAFFYHIVFGTIVDTALVLLGKKPELMSVYRKATFATAALLYFDREFTFDNDNLYLLIKMIHPKDRADFHFQIDGSKDDYLEISREQLRGVCRYALHERMDKASCGSAARHNTRLWWAELSWYLLLAVGALCLLVRRYG